MHLGVTKRWLLLPLAAVLAVALVVGMGARDYGTVHAQGPTIEVDGDPGTGGVQTATPPVAVGNATTIEIVIGGTPAPYTTYQWKLEFPNADVDYVTGSGVHLSPAGLTSCSAFGEGTSGANDFVATFCGAASAITFTGPVDQIDMQCLTAGSHPLHLVTTGEDPVSGTTVVGQTTATVDGTLECELQSDLVIEKTDDPDPVVAGDPLTYTVTTHNAGPNPLGGVGTPPNASGAVIADVVPIEKTVQGTPGVSDTCAAAPSPANCPALVPFPAGVTETLNAAPSGVDIMWFEGFDGSPFGFPFITNLVLVDYSGNLLGLGGGNIVINQSDTSVVTIVVDVPISDAGKQNANVALAGILGNVDPDPTDEPECAVLEGLGLIPPTLDNSVGCEFTDVEPADVSITKSPDATQYSEGDTITWTVEVTSNGPSPASDVVISDTVGANQSLVSGTLTGSTATDYDCVETSSDAADIVGSTATCTLDGPVPAGDTETMDVVADVVGSDGNLCVNDAAVEWADPLSDDTQETVPCFPPTVRMEKDVNDDPLTIEDEANLWICEGPTCDENGEGSLTVYERVVNVANDPDGAGAYEFQVKFNHKLFDIEVEDSSWLSNGGARDVTCDMTIITENWILFGCVSSGPVPGQTADGVMATLTITPEPDMKYRLTPGQDNGVFDVILDENCEIADVLGDPLMLQDESGNDIALAPGVLPGGLIEVCSDIGVTIRILEGDLNLDCIVDVLDQQAIAFRYGSSFGMLLYDDWYDLEPALKDFDIDIKDLQKVWGRQGSECSVDGSGSIPPQPPVPFP